jgi:hypothetical protein
LADSLKGFLRDRGSRIGLEPAAKELAAAVDAVLLESGQHVARSGVNLSNCVAPPALVAQLRVYLRAAGRIVGLAEAAREMSEARAAAEDACGFVVFGGWNIGCLTRDPIAVLPEKRRRA